MLKCKRQTSDGRDRIQLAGQMLEGTERLLEPLVDAAGVDVVFDFAGVTAINSCGVAEWVTFLRTFGAGRSIVLERCPHVLVDLFNAAPAFKGKCAIKSVGVPFSCPSCQTEVDALYEMTAQPVRDLEKAAVPCKKCGTRMAPAVDLDDYFAFMSAD